MKNCPKCNNEFEELSKWRNIRTFCSRVCANSHVRSTESKNKTSAALMGRPSTRKQTHKKNCVICKDEFIVTGRQKNRVTLFGQLF
jgi:hypothetical protein